MKLTPWILGLSQLMSPSRSRKIINRLRRRPQMVEILEDRSLLTPAPFVVGSKVFRDGPATATFTIVLTEINPTQNTTISYQTTLNGTAQANDDFVVIPPSTLVIPAGARSAEVSVSINSADSSDPRTETVELSASLGATTSTAVATLIRTGLDSLPGIEFQDDIISSSDAYLDYSLAEGTSGTKTLNAAIISSSGAFNGDVQVSWTTYPISATSPNDFTAQAGTVTLNATNTSAAIAVPIVTDSTDEFDEYFGLRITSITGNAYVYDSQAVVQIVDDDLPSVSISAPTPSSVAEDGAPNLVFQISRTSTAGDLPVNINISGTAILQTLTTPADYALTMPTGNITSTNTVVTIPDGQSVISLTANPTADIEPELNESVQITIAGTPNYTIGTATASGLITNDDAPPPLPTVSISAVASTGGTVGSNVVAHDSIAGANQAIFRFSRTGSTSGSLQVKFATSAANSAESDDYSPSILAGSPYSEITIPASQSSVDLVVTASPDSPTSPDNDNETLAVNLVSNSAYSIGTGSAQIQILEYVAPTITILDATASEPSKGSGTLVFPIQVAGSVTPFTSVNIAVNSVAGTTAGSPGHLPITYPATAVADYVTVSSNLTFSAPGTYNVPVSIVNETVFEPDESFYMDLSLLSGPTGTLLVDPQAIGTILNDDAPPPIVSISNAGALSNAVATDEGNPGETVTLTFNVTVTGTLTGTVKVDVATVEGNISGTPGHPAMSNPATAGIDYVTKSETLSFSTAGTLPFSVTVNPDLWKEINERFFRIGLRGWFGGLWLWLEDEVFFDLRVYWGRFDTFDEGAALFHFRWPLPFAGCERVAMESRPTGCLLVFVRQACGRISRKSSWISRAASAAREPILQTTAPCPGASA